MSASSLTVSVSVPPNARTLRAMVPCFCCLPAACALGLLPSAFCAKSDDHSRTTRQVAVELAEHIGGRRTLGPGGGGGAKARAAAPERRGEV